MFMLSHLLYFIILLFLPPTSVFTLLNLRFHYQFITNCEDIMDIPLTTNTWSSYHVTLFLTTNTFTFTLYTNIQIIKEKEKRKISTYFCLFLKRIWIFCTTRLSVISGFECLFCRARFCIVIFFKCSLSPFFITVQCTVSLWYCVLPLIMHSCYVFLSLWTSVVSTMQLCNRATFRCSFFRFSFLFSDTRLHLGILWFFSCYLFFQKPTLLSTSATCPELDHSVSEWPFLLWLCMHLKGLWEVTSQKHTVFLKTIVAL